MPQNTLELRLGNDRHEDHRPVRSEPQTFRPRRRGETCRLVLQTDGPGDPSGAIDAWGEPLWIDSVHQLV